MKIIKVLTVTLIGVGTICSGTVSMAGEIHDAVRNGDLAKVTSLLKADPKLANARDTSGWTPLECIAFRMVLNVSLNSDLTGTAASVPVKDPMLEIAKILIASGAEVDPQPSKTAVLLGAVRGQNWPLARLLIENGAKVDVAMVSGGDKGMTPLHYACASGNVEIVKLLIANKAPVSAKEADGYSPLHLAARWNRFEIVKLLIDAGADVIAKTNEGKTPLELATEHNNNAMMQLLQQSSRIPAKEAVSTPASEGQATNPQPSVFKTEQDKVSYIIGTQIGQSIKIQDVEVDLGLLMLGLKDVLEGNTLQLTQAEIQKVYAAFQQRLRAKQMAERAKQATENLAKGTVFLEANMAKEGVTVLPSGLQYKVLKEGTGETPTANDKVKTHYRGTLIDGTEFDSSYKRNQPAEFAVTGVIKGWTEALQLMKTGAKWELYIPADLAYGTRGRPSIPPNSVLIFEIELLEIVK